MRTIQAKMSKHKKMHSPSILRLIRSSWLKEWRQICESVLTVSAVSRTIQLLMNTMLERSLRYAMQDDCKLHQGTEGLPIPAKSNTTMKLLSVGRARMAPLSVV